MAIGDRQIDYSDNFKFFLTSTDPNPHYSPEVSVKVTIINFAVTKVGLQDQMLQLVVRLELPQLEQKKLDLVKKNAADQNKLLVLEDEILKKLSESKGDILENQELIDGLQKSKKMSTDIMKRVEQSKITERGIDETRKTFIPVAKRASILFFSISDLGLTNKMYQFSLQWYRTLFAQCQGRTPENEDLEGEEAEA